MISYSTKIVRVKHINDDTTGGKDVYIDDYGNEWIPTTYTKQNAPTGMRIGYLKADGSVYE